MNLPEIWTGSMQLQKPLIVDLQFCNIDFAQLAGLSNDGGHVIVRTSVANVQNFQIRKRQANVFHDCSSNASDIVQFESVKVCSMVVANAKDGRRRDIGDEIVEGEAAK